MKKVLIIDESPLFREYLRLKLQDNDIKVSIGMHAADGIAKMISAAPDLIILDSALSRKGYMEVLKEKKADPNTSDIPVLLMSQRIDQKQLVEMVPYSVKKVFTKPVKIDTLFVTLSEQLGITFNIDESPGIVEVHVNDNIVFIELAQGLNRDKLDLLRFKIIELMELYEIRLPKVIVMLSDISLNENDITNLDKLLLAITRASRAKHKNIKVLTKDNFTRKYIQGHKDFAALEVVSNLQDAIDNLLEEMDSRIGLGETKEEIIEDMVLAADTSSEEEEIMALKFHAELSKERLEIMKESLQNVRIGAVDDDFIIQELIKNAFRDTGAKISTFSDGEEFINSLGSQEFDLVFLDLLMPNKDGFEVLNHLKNADIQYPIIVLSAVTERDVVLKAYNMGIRSYLIKPLKPQDIFKKSIEVLRPDF